MKLKGPHPLEEIPTSVGSFFMDSGAHSIYTREVIAQKGRNGYKFYESEEFYRYVDSYAKFIKKYGWAVDYYANVDAIFNPEISYKVQKYLEDKHKLKPVPVIHFGTDLKWIHRYLKEGYEFLGIGGLGQEVTKEEYYGWADQVFSILCPASNASKPIVRTHGFAMTSWELMRRYPWWSVDSASWIKAAAYGMIYVPHLRKGVFTFDEKPYTINASDKSPSMSEKGKHITTLTEMEAQVIIKWLNKINVPLGGRFVNSKGGRVHIQPLPVEKERGVMNHHKPRAENNLAYFFALAESLPEWPWAFCAQVKKGFF